MLVKKKVYGKHKFKRKRMGRMALLAHKKFTWWSRVSELGRGKEEGVNN
jgi:hypothetical protein